MNDKSLAGPMMTTEEMFAKITNAELIRELTVRVLNEEITRTDLMTAFLGEQDA